MSSTPTDPWTPTDARDALDPRDLNGGTVVADYEHDLGARIVVEDLGGAVNFAITSGIYGWFFHTCRYSSRADAFSASTAMQSALDEILKTIPRTDDPDRDAKCAAVSDAISAFVDRFP